MDSPPAGGVDPNLTVNFTINSVVGRFLANGGQSYQFTHKISLLPVWLLAMIHRVIYTTKLLLKIQPEVLWCFWITPIYIKVIL